MSSHSHVVCQSGVSNSFFSNEARGGDVTERITLHTRTTLLQSRLHPLTSQARRSLHCPDRLCNCHTRIGVGGMAAFLCLSPQETSTRVCYGLLYERQFE
jgi:hypothetical protein